MNYLLDTNVVSEWTKPQPHPGVAAWIANADEDRLFISVVTLAELRHGIERMPAGKRRDRLDTWLREDLVLRFEMRIVSIDNSIADTWGRIMARTQAAGQTIQTMDAFLGATAEARGLTLVTRNVTDFAALEAPIVNPWTDA